MFRGTFSTVDGLKKSIHDGLRDNVPNIPAVVRIGEWLHHFTEINKEGRAVTFRFWSWGDDETMAMANLNTTFEAYTWLFAMDFGRREASSIRLFRTRLTCGPGLPTSGLLSTARLFSAVRGFSPAVTAALSRAFPDTCGKFALSDFLPGAVSACSRCRSLASTVSISLSLLNSRRRWALVFTSGGWTQ